MAKGSMNTQFVGAPCGHHGPYTFYKAFKYFKHGKHKILTLGEFFFARISPHDDPCIGELQLLWEDCNSEQILSSTRLYFLPEQTPEGRRSQHGEHEVVAAAEKVILRLSDLVSWITEEVEWTHGLIARCEEDIPPVNPQPTLVPVGGPGSATLELPEGVDWVQVFRDSHYSLDVKDVKQEKELLGCEKNDKEGSSVMILSYPRYCRLRGVLKRLDGVEDKWLRNALVAALGGFVLSSRNTRILFCRDTFEHDGLAQHDLNCEHLAPNLKGRPRKKRGKTHRSVSPGAESNTSDESKEILSNLKLKNGLKKPNCKDEQEFLQKLFKFMQERETPIQRVPHLGFKQINLYFFYTFAQKLGGYDKVTGKKLWKLVYDELGGNPGSTSAATCTRRHYERLLLPFERHMNGQDASAPPIMQSKPRIRKTKKESTDKEDADCKNNSDNDAAKDEDGTNSGTPAEESKGRFEDDEKDDGDDEEEGEEDVFPHQAEQKPEESTPDVKVEGKISELEKQEMEWEARRRRQKQVTKTRECDSPFLEQERRWNEIRKRNALARGRVRPVKPSSHPCQPVKLTEPSVTSCVTPRTPLSSEATPAAAFSLPLKEMPQPIIRQEYEQLSNSSNDDADSPCPPTQDSKASITSSSSRVSGKAEVPPVIPMQDYSPVKKPPSAPVCFSAAVPFPYAASPLLSMSAHMTSLPQHSVLPTSTQDVPQRSYLSSKDAASFPTKSHQAAADVEVKSRLAPSIMAPLFYRKTDPAGAPPPTPQVAHKNHPHIKSEYPPEYQSRPPEDFSSSGSVPLNSTQRRPSVILHTAEQMRTPPPPSQPPSDAAAPPLSVSSYNAINQKIPIFPPQWRTPGGKTVSKASSSVSSGVCDMTLRQLSNKLSQREADRSISMTTKVLSHSLHDSIKRHISAADASLYQRMARDAHSSLPRSVGPHPKRPRLSITTPYTINSVAKSSPPHFFPETKNSCEHVPSTSFLKPSGQEEVLDLSMKKTTQEADSRTSPQVPSRASTASPIPECLDLSVKKKPLPEPQRISPPHATKPSRPVGPVPVYPAKPHHHVIPTTHNSIPHQDSPPQIRSHSKVATTDLYSAHVVQNAQVPLGVLPMEYKSSRHPVEPTSQSHAAYPPLQQVNNKTRTAESAGVPHYVPPSIPSIVAPSMYSMWSAAHSAAMQQDAFLAAEMQSSLAAYHKLMDQRGVFAAPHYPYPVSPQLAAATRYKDDAAYKRFSK